MTPGRKSFSRRLLAALSWLAPAAGRRPWLEEWDAELHQLQARRSAGDRGLPGVPRFVAGAIPHLLWERKEWAAEVLLQDVRFAWRSLARTPGFAALAVLTVALGIGAGTTIFSLVSSTLLRPPTGIVDDSDLVLLGRDRPEGFDNFAYPYVVEFGRARSLARVAAYTVRSFVVGQGADTLPVPGQLVTGDYFRVLGLEPAAGRLLGPGDDADGGSPVVVISERLWGDRFASDPGIAGRDLFVNGRTYAIVGVVSGGFRGTDVATAATDLWVPLAMAGAALGPRYADYDRPGFSWLWVVGRRTPGVSTAQLRQEIDSLYRTRFHEAWGEEPDSGVAVVEGIGLRPEERAFVRGLMALLMAVVVVVMVVASANLGNLLLVRGATRGRELGVRVALGAGRLRLLRQLMTESMLLAAAGGVAGLVVTLWTARLLPLLLPTALGVDLRPDRNVVLFGMAASLAVGLLFGILPALRATGGDVVGALRDGSAQARRNGVWMRRVLVTGQLALSFALLVVAGMMVQSLRNARAAEPGYATRDVLTVALDLDLAGYSPGDGQVFWDELLERVSALPGVASAALGSNTPFAGWSRRSVPLPEPPENGPDFFQFDMAWISSGYVDTLGIRLLEGQGLTLAGAEMPWRGALLSESAAGLLFPQGGAVGRDLPQEADDEGAPVRVLGIVADVQNRSLRERPRPSMYLSARQEYAGRMTLFVRAAGNPLALSQPVRSAIQDLDPDVGILAMRTLHERMAESLTDTVAMGRVAVVSGALALALATIGLYGVIAYLTAQRAHEIGVRRALGARGSHVLGMVLRQGLGLGALGIGAGTLIAVPAAGLLGSLLYGVAPGDPLLLSGIAATLLVVVGLASLQPARRATRVEPVSALRQD